MEQFYGVIIWYHLMAPFYGMCVPDLNYRTTNAENKHIKQN